MFLVAPAGVHLAALAVPNVALVVEVCSNLNKKAYNLFGVRRSSRYLLMF